LNDEKLLLDRSIAAAKEAELRLVAEAIRSERAATLAPRRPGFRISSITS